MFFFPSPTRASILTWNSTRDLRQRNCGEMFTTHGDSSLKAASMAVASLLTHPSTFLDFPPISTLRLMKRFFTRTFKTQMESHQNIKLLKSRLQFPLKGNEIELNEISCNVSRVRLTAFFVCFIFSPFCYRTSWNGGVQSVTQGWLFIDYCTARRWMASGSCQLVIRTRSFDWKTTAAKDMAYQWQKKRSKLLVFWHT